MVAGRPDEREPAALRRLDRAAGREQRSLPARVGGNGVGIEQRRDFDRLEPVQVRGLVAALDLLPRRRRAFEDLEAVENDREPLPRLDVRLRRVQLGERGMAD
jgi:hypothetical protein